MCIVLHPDSTMHAIPHHGHQGPRTRCESVDLYSVFLLVDAGFGYGGHVK
jgi:hypothetical protein